ncbi:rod shape-determining protein MreD [Sulfitobacter sp. SK012]|uniref:rod shape-determining protein MreD n=1 Tax=Sulfitobacter sp. SK012 TaxID=1389005 RepID=UPI000E0B308D|nr:rod shape-determining protein MreD [Sulfitobacter sp. SK012]AXI48135.1 rod shape-determining protein MreD [Sulfitobacter sp. SK012]
MNELSPARLWLMRAGFVLLTALIIFYQLLPLDTAPVDLFTTDLVPLAASDSSDARLERLLHLSDPRRWIGPDLLLGFAMAWSLRRPEYVPAILLAGIFLLADMLLQRPPGLLALLTLVGCENLKMRERGLRDATFVAEWIAVAFVMVSIFIANRIILSLLLVDTAPWGLSLIELGMTLLFYPLIAGVTHGLMGVRKTAPGELDSKGQRA